jgi:hypothetical protein
MSDHTPTDPTEALFELVVILLTPLFLCPATNIDLHRARQAAMATLDGYHAASVPELILAAQIIGCSLTSLGSMGLSMDDDLPVPAILRLRANANALTGSSLRLHITLARTRKDIADTHRKFHQDLQEQERKQRQAAYDVAQHTTEADVIAETAKVREMAAQGKARLQQAQAGREPPAAPAHSPAQQAAKLPPLRPANMTEEQERKLGWATAMAKVAEEEASAMPFIAPEERSAHKARLAALNAAATQLMREATELALKPNMMSGSPAQPTDPPT